MTGPTAIDWSDGASGPGLRVLVTAASTRLGTAVVAELETRDDVATVIAVDHRTPSAPFRVAEFVRLGEDHAQLPRVAHGAEIDVLVDLRAAAALAPPDEPALREHGAVTERITDACRQEGSTVRRLVSVGSIHRHGWSAHQPAFVSETTEVPARSSGPIQRALREVEQGARTATDDAVSPELTLVRLADPVGPAGVGLLQTAERMPLLPTVLGFDPPVQVVHEDDAARAVAFVVGEQLDGTYLVAADGTLALSEALRALGRAHAPLLPPWGTGLIAAVLQRAGVGTAHDLAGQLRHGRGVDNRKLKAHGFHYRATTREALESAARTRRGRRLLGLTTARSSEVPATTPYEPEVEAFLRYSPSARRGASEVEPAPQRGVAALEVDAIVALLSSMDPDALRALREHEDAGPRRGRILDEIDHLLRRR